MPLACPVTQNPMPGHFPPTLRWGEDAFKLVFQFNNRGNAKKKKEKIKKKIKKRVRERCPTLRELNEANLLCLSRAVVAAKWVIVADFASCSYRHRWKEGDPKLRDEIKTEQKNRIKILKESLEQEAEKSRSNLPLRGDSAKYTLKTYH